MNSKKRPLTLKEATLKAADFCAYQERTQQQVRDKLYDYGLRSDEVEEALGDLITEGFVNEERYALAYAGGKFRMKKWGRLKILQGLKTAKISEYCINRAMLEIDEDVYESTLRELLEKKKSTVSGANQFIVSKKLANYAMQKGYEAELVWNVIRSLE